MQSISQRPKQQQDILMNYQKNVFSIHQDRRRILNALSQKYKQKKYLTQSDDNKFKSRTSMTQIQDNPRKLVKLSSQYQVQNTLSAQNLTKYDKDVGSKQQSKKVERKTQIPQAIADRNRRMFGGLTSHLKKAGQHLKSQQFKEKQRSAKEILNKLISKEKQQRQQVQNKKREELDVLIKKLQQQKKQADKKLIQTENIMLSQIVKVHLNTVGQFNITRTEPRICWKPSKALQMVQKEEKIKQSTQKYLKVRLNYYKKKLEQECLSKIQGYNQVVDHSNYMTQNERQFYGNFINKIYEQYNGFLLTKAQPQVFWKPKVVSSKFSDLLAETKSMLEQKSQTLKKINQDFYLTKKCNPQDQLAKEILDQQNEEQQDLVQKPIYE